MVFIVYQFVDGEIPGKDVNVDFSEFITVAEIDTKRPSLVST